MKNCSKRKAGFTLIEISVVLAIVFLLAAILFTVFLRVKENGRSSICQSNLQQIALGFQQYVQDNDGRYPQPSTSKADGSKTYWPEYISPYIKDERVYFCPDRVRSGNLVFKEMNTSYSYNGLALEQLQTSPPQIRIKSNFHEVIVRNPSEVVLNFDETGDEDLDVKVPVSSTGCTDIISPNSPDFYMAALHSGGANYSFYDGHVKWLNPVAAAAIGCNSRLKF